jgi:hypothetical protein
MAGRLNLAGIMVNPRHPVKRKTSVGRLLTIVDRTHKIKSFRVVSIGWSASLATALSKAG